MESQPTLQNPNLTSGVPTRPAGSPPILWSPNLLYGVPTHPVDSQPTMWGPNLLYEVLTHPVEYQPTLWSPNLLYGVPTHPVESQPTLWSPNAPCGVPTYPAESQPTLWSRRSRKSVLEAFWVCAVTLTLPSKQSKYNKMLDLLKIKLTENDVYLMGRGGIQKQPIPDTKQHNSCLKLLFHIPYLCNFIIRTLTFWHRNTDLETCYQFKMINTTWWSSFGWTFFKENLV